MSDIFENLENLQVSEECFNDIMDIVEEMINEVSVGYYKKSAKSSLPGRIEAAQKLTDDNTEGEITNVLNRKNRASGIAHNPRLKDNSKMSALKVKKAAENSLPKRDAEQEKAEAEVKASEDRWNKTHDRNELDVGAQKGNERDEKMFRHREARILAGKTPYKD